ncbi:phage terminase large subunit family protein [uncultured Bilophila sp.]|uniref:phage terminase large subunit family protein n=1 Tax=uncultured Bilophila sp. TaxID=529385 RepID=UPI00280C1A51|nr:phage terminase large subunit family protein [uncultured Bilophila sp.]
MGTVVRGRPQGAVRTSGRQVSGWENSGRGEERIGPHDTTEDGPIWKAFTEEAGARFDSWVCCPHCGFSLHMDFECIAWPEKDEESPDAETVLAKRLAYYACEYCGTVWDDGDRAVRGVTRPRIRP